MREEREGRRGSGVGQRSIQERTKEGRPMGAPFKSADKARAREKTNMVRMVVPGAIFR